MNESPSKGSNLIETTDSLEAIGVFRGWKNFFFLIVLACLVIVQGVFWLAEAKFVKFSDTPLDDQNVIAAEEPDYTNQTITPNTEEIDHVGSTNGSVDTESGRLVSFLLNLRKFEHVSKVIKVVNGVLLVTAILYCLAMLFSLQVSLISRLGGMNHISRAFFLSLIMLVLLIPWQKILGHGIVGAVYMPDELAKWWHTKSDGIRLGGSVLYYLRFCGYWLLIMLLLIQSQLRSRRWSKAILRRLEII